MDLGRPPAERNTLDVATSPNFRGYVPMGITGPNVPRRLVEAFQMMIELGPDDPDVRAGNVMYRSQPLAARGAGVSRRDGRHSLT